jgi:exodeoxyribonuclease VII large subunit
MAKKNRIIRVSELNRYLKSLITGDPNLQDIWVSGELSNFKHHRSGHMYFTVKDGASSLRCVFFKGDNLRCLFEPTDGMAVLLNGSISVYEPDGVYQLYVREMEPAGFGSLYLAYEQLKNKLEEEGLFRPEKKKPLPLLPRKIALLTSPTGAALQDMLTIFQKRFPALQILVVECLVQGAGAARDLVRALEQVNLRKDVDLIIIARGGGSLEDLWPFNDEDLARAIDHSVIPIISAVGHETDFTIADFVADLRAPTPTAAAQLAVPALDDQLQHVAQYRRRAAVALHGRILREKQKLDQVTGDRFFQAPLKKIALQRETLQRSEKALKKNVVGLLRLKGLELAARTEKLESFNPLRVMSRGFSYCRDQDGRIVRSVKDVAVGSRLQLNFTDGRAFCRTEAVEEEAAFEG